MPEPFNAALPSVVPLSLNVIVPVGTPGPDAITPAVKVTEAPEYKGLTLAAIVTLVFS